MSQDNEVLVRVSGVSKKFCRDLKKSLWYGVKDVASELLPIKHPKSKIQNSASATDSHSKFNIQNSKFSPPLRDGEFWAVKDVSFELRRGECIGLIKPDSATIEMR